MKKVTAKELLDMVANGASVTRHEEPAPPPPPPPDVKVNVEMGPVHDGMSAMRSSIQHMQAWQQDLGERLVTELEKINARTAATLTVTKRNDDGGIESARIELET